MLKKQIQIMKNGSVDDDLDKIKLEFRKVMDQLNADREFIQKANHGSEFMAEDDQKRVADIGNYKWVYEGKETTFLNETEIRNLQISKGTLLPPACSVLQSLRAGHFSNATLS